MAPARRPLYAAPNRLSRILDHQQTVLPGRFENRVHVGSLAIEMDRDDHAGPRRDRFLDLARINVVSVTLDIDEDGLGAPCPRSSRRSRKRSTAS